MKKILVIAPHADDETLGCGGTILKHNHQGDQCNWLIMTKMSNSTGYSKKQIQKRELEIIKVRKLLSFKNVINFNFETSKLDTIPLSILVKSISEVIKKIKPNILYIPCSTDIHSDHRITSNAVIASSKSFRHNYIKSIREYEVLSETDYSLETSTTRFNPNLWIDISKFLNKKIQVIKTYSGEIQKFPKPRSIKNIKALAINRGCSISCAAAESFRILKQID